MELRGERIRRQAMADMRLKDVLGSAELERIRTRDTLPRGRRSLRPDFELGVGDASGTLKNLDAIKDVEEETTEEQKHG
ncbi:hypothetical protein HDU81_001302 [Chytriomyces hyalinus]|nr:hypothetical protein HDU81_001302 [Chytriomyces hyalinus]